MLRILAICRSWLLSLALVRRRHQQPCLFAASVQMVEPRWSSMRVIREFQNTVSNFSARVSAQSCLSRMQAIWRATARPASR
ncbi:unnamed protein product, partial [Ixodes persulcatus]